MKGRDVSMDVKKELRNSIVVLTLSYAAENGHGLKLICRESGR